MKRSISALLRHLILLGFLIFALIPLYWIFITSIKPPEELYALPLTYWPKLPTFDNYRELFDFADFGRYFANSLFVTLLASIGAMSVATLAGYALSRGRKANFDGGLMMALYLTQMIPPFILMIPLYTTLTGLGFTDSLLVLALVYVAVTVSFSTIMAKSFFDRVPKILDEAAAIDGCGSWSCLFRIVMPLIFPGLTAIFCFSFVNIWNELFLAAILISTGVKLTIPVALSSFISKTGISWGLLSAGIVIALLPTMFVFAFGQRYIVAGLTQGAVKE